MHSNVIRQHEMREKVVNKIHPLNESAQRRTFSLGDATGLAALGLHYTLVSPGDRSTELHSHVYADEFVFILAGSGRLELDHEQIDVAAGDFIGLPARGPAHRLYNTGSVDLAYLVGGNRPSFDVCNYPEKRVRLFHYHEGSERAHDFVDFDDVQKR